MAHGLGAISRPIRGVKAATPGAVSFASKNALSALAYGWLGFPLEKIPRDRSARFLAGMADASTRDLLSDPPVACWDSWAQTPIHAILSLFDNNRAVLDALVEVIRA